MARLSAMKDTSSDKTPSDETKRITRSEKETSYSETSAHKAWEDAFDGTVWDEV